MKGLPLVAGAVCVTLALLPAPASGGRLQDALRELGPASQNDSPRSARSGDTTSTEIASGLREALAKGARQAILTLGRRDGFWGNPEARIPLPSNLARSERLLRQLGQGRRVDDFLLSMNRAAEQAVPEAAELIGEAVRRLSFDDARRILTGPDDAATAYFRRSVGERLAQRFRPIVARATDSVGVTRQYKKLGGSLRGGVGELLLEGRDGAALDLDGYVTDRALDALFAAIAEQERAIRRDPLARTSELLRRVFGR